MGRHFVLRSSFLQLRTDCALELYAFSGGEGDFGAQPLNNLLTHMFTSWTSSSSERIFAELSKEDRHFAFKAFLCMPVTKKEKSHRATNWASNALAVVHACYHPTIPMRRDLPRSGKADMQSFLERRSTAPPPDHGKPAHDSPNNGRREASYLPPRRRRGRRLPLIPSPSQRPSSMPPPRPSGANRNPREKLHIWHEMWRPRPN